MPSRTEKLLRLLAVVRAIVQARLGPKRLSECTSATRVEDLLGPKVTYVSPALLRNPYLRAALEGSLSSVSTQIFANEIK